MAVEFLLAAVAGRRRLVGLLKPAATGSRRSNRTTSTAAGDGTRGTGPDLPAVTCGSRRALKVEEINSPVATAAVASIPIASLRRGGTGCRRAGSVPISPAALGHFSRIGGRRVVKQVVNPAATRHAKTTGAPGAPRPPPPPRAPLQRGRRAKAARRPARAPATAPPAAPRARPQQLWGKTSTRCTASAAATASSVATWTTSKSSTPPI